MSKCTPGPWEFSGFCRVDNCFHVGTVGERGCTGIHLSKTTSMAEVVADVFAGGAADEIGDANARLIAAAPDLLHAAKLCEEIMDVLAEAGIRDWLDRNPGLGGRADAWAKAHVAARAAIVKAEAQA